MLQRPDAIGFSNVDASQRSDELIAYLAHIAGRVAAIRAADFARLRLCPNEAVLDVGCGAGEVCVELARRVGPGGRVCGVDLSEAMIDVARKAAETVGVLVEHQVAGIYALPYPDATFDVVRAERVFQHIDDPVRALAEMVRVARPGGRIMVMDPDHSQCSQALDNRALEHVSEAVRSQFLRDIANPHIGIRLRGLFVGAGLRELDLVVRALELTWEDFVPATFLRQRLHAVVVAGAISEQDSNAFFSALQSQAEHGKFLAMGVGYSMLGTKP
jgi:SAM-dependent methyltransferase